MLQCGPWHWWTPGGSWNGEDAACKSVGHWITVPGGKHWSGQKTICKPLRKIRLFIQGSVLTDELESKSERILPQNMNTETKLEVCTEAGLGELGLARNWTSHNLSLDFPSTITIYIQTESGAVHVWSDHHRREERRRQLNKDITAMFVDFKLILPSYCRCWYLPLPRHQVHHPC